MKIYQVYCPLYDRNYGDFDDKRKAEICMHNKILFICIEYEYYLINDFFKKALNLKTENSNEKVNTEILRCSENKKHCVQNLLSKVYVEYLKKDDEKELYNDVYNEVCTLLEKYLK